MISIAVHDNFNFRPRRFSCYACLRLLGVSSRPLAGGGYQIGGLGREPYLSTAAVLGWSALTDAALPDPAPH